jgi:glycosyltransferase involved in cell wall biosynthesis
MAVYNGAHYLPEQVDSILNQTYPHVRLLIRDNASTDGTWDLLQHYATAYPERIAVLPRNSENIGALGNFAAVFAAADVGYVMFADADDVWVPDKIESSLQRMTALEKEFGSGTPLLVHSDLEVVDRKLNVVDPSFWHYQKIDPENGCQLGRLLVCNAVTGCTLLLNPALVRLSRPIPRSRAIMHDYWIALVAACFGQIAHVDRALVRYRQHGRNDTGAKRWDGSIGAILRKPWNPLDEGSTRLFRTEMETHYLQARALLEVFGDSLPAKARQTIEAFLDLPTRSFIGRRVSAIRNGFWKTGLIRNISLLTRI